MALYKIAEFAKLTGKKPKYIHTIISRGKLIKNQNRQIDTNEPTNALWLEENQIIQESQTIESIELTELQKINMEQKQLAIQKAKKEIEIRQIEIDKLQGSLIDSDKTIRIVKSYANNFKRDLKQKFEVLIQDICTRHDIPADKAGEYKMKVLDAINLANKVATASLRAEFKDLEEQQ